jgi:hypothetical protein
MLDTNGLAAVEFFKLEKKLIAANKDEFYSYVYSQVPSVYFAHYLKRRPIQEKIVTHEHGATILKLMAIANTLAAKSILTTRVTRQKLLSHPNSFIYLQEIAHAQPECGAAVSCLLPVAKESRKEKETAN